MQLEQGLVKVTVVVPVYNPGPFIEPAIESMLGQTLPPDEYEVVFVDDGSTDESPARLDALAAAQPNMRVIHTPNSGWPGRPRNIGIGAASGEYVQFMDQDDSMTPDALRGLYEMGRRNRSDIVIGKVASDFRPVPQHLFRGNIDACTIRDAPLISSLTPHKMFRTAFLRENRIEFPEGRRRLEDQLFMVRAYLAARTVSVLADTVCYYYSRRADGRNAGDEMPDPAMYFGNLREILEVVVNNTEPGVFRTELLSRFYRTGMIDRLSEPYYLSRSEPMRQALYDEIRGVARDFAADDVEAMLGTIRQIRSRLLRADRQPELVALAERLRDLRARATLTELRWAGRRLIVGIHAGLAFMPDQRPFRLVRRDGVTIIDPAILQGIVDVPVPVVEPHPWVRLQCFLRDRATGTEWRVPMSVRVGVHRERGDRGDVRLRPEIRAVASIDVDRIAGGRPLAAGSWELLARVFGPGIDRRARVITGDGELALPAAMSGSDGGHVYVASVSKTLGVVVQAVARTVEIASRAQMANGQGGPETGKLAGAPSPPALLGSGPLVFEIPVAAPAADPPLEIDVEARRGRTRHRLAGGIDRRAGTMVLEVRATVVLDEPGEWRLAARLDGPDRPERAVGTLEVAPPASGEPGPIATVPLGLRDRVRQFARPRRRARVLARRLSMPVRQRLAGLAGRWIR